MSKPQTRPLIRALLIDVSGTLHVGNKATPDAIEAFRRLRLSDIPFRLCSNTSKESTRSLISRLNRLGFSLVHSAQDENFSNGAGGNSEAISRSQRPCKHRQEVWTSIGAVSRYIQNQGLKRPYLLLSPSAKEEVTRDISERLDDPDYAFDSVVVGLAPEMFDYSHLNTAFRILKGEIGQSEAQRRTPTSRTTTLPLIATHRARYIQTENPYGLSLGPGPFVSALETASGVQAHVIGKPTRLFFETVVNDFYVSGELEQNEHRGRIAVIGDDVEADLGDGAIQMGLWRVLVKTRKYRSGDENRPGIVSPDEVLDTFATFIDSLLGDTQVSAPNTHKL